MSLDRSGRRDFEALLARPPSDFKSWFIDEPPLMFGRHHHAADPKIGVAQFGPFGTGEDPPLARVRVGLVGSGEAIQRAQEWLSRCRTEISVHKDDRVDPGLFPHFPGFSTPTGFSCELDMPAALLEKLTPRDIAHCTAASNRDVAVEAMAKVVSERLQALSERESPPDVVLVALDEQVRTAAGGGRRPRHRNKRIKPSPQLSFFDEKREEPEPISRTLHRAIKGEGMRHNLPTQLVWPTTFSGGEGTQDAATRAWNFCTALHHKARGVPWRATGLAKGTCYVGISFFRPLGSADQLQTSLAQAFSERGEGTVLRGSSFAWDKKLGPPRLPREAAKELLRGVIDQYRLHHRQFPTRVVVHKSSQFSDDEASGMIEALGDDVPYYDLVTIARSNIRFLRAGYEPPIRGTAIEVAPKRYIVYTRGYVPFLRVYPGLRIPRPLEVVHSRGSAPITELLTELFALTRMNWNSADFASAEPITMGFSRKVGLILSELPEGITPASAFRFYM